LKFANILVGLRTAVPQTWFLDLDAVQWRSSLPRRRAIQNLARFNVSSLVMRAGTGSDRVRFLKRYLGSRFSSEWKTWWRAIARRSMLKQRQNAQRGRPLT
jgi:hypothetical protein